MAFRAGVISTYYTPASTGAKTVTVPTNAVGDIIMLRAFFESNVTVTSWPTGFTGLTSTTFLSGHSGILHWAWKRVSGSADTGTYSVTPSGSTTIQMVVSSWSGRVATGTPFSFTTQNQVTSSTTGPPALTGTAAAGDDLSYGFNEWNGTSGLTVAGFTLIAEDTATGAHSFKAENVSAGSVSAQASATVSNNWWVTLASIIAAPAGGAGIPDLVMAPMRSGF